MDVTEPNENEYTRNGVRYVSKPSNRNSCDGCAHDLWSVDCDFAPDCETSDYSIIWVVAK